MYEYPLDPYAYKDLQVNILLGSALKLSMETTSLDFTQSRNYYFPKDRWCRIYPEIQSLKDDCFDSPGGANGYQSFPTTLESYYIHLRNGYIVPYQDAPGHKVRKTLDLTTFGTDFYALPLDPVSTPKSTALALGHLYFDDGVSVIADDASNYKRFDIALTQSDDKKTMTFVVVPSGNMKQPDPLPADHSVGTIYVLWASKSGLSSIKSVTLTKLDKTTVAITPATSAQETVSLPINVSLWDIDNIAIALN